MEENEKSNRMGTYFNLRCMCEIWIDVSMFQFLDFYSGNIFVHDLSNCWTGGNNICPRTFVLMHILYNGIYDCNFGRSLYLWQILNYISMHQVAFLVFPATMPSLSMQVVVMVPVTYLFGGAICCLGTTTLSIFIQFCWQSFLQLSSEVMSFIGNYWVVCFVTCLGL